MSERALSLKQWFYRNARVPILFTLVSFLGVEALLLTVVGKNQFEHQQGVAERLAAISRLALEEKSSALLQVGFDIARKELKASNAFVCEQSLVYVTIPPRLSQCSLEKRVFERTIEVNLELPNRLRTPPFQQHKFILQVPIWPRDELIYYTLGISLGVCLLGIGLLRRLSRRLEKDLFSPLFKNLSSNLRIPIRELEEIRQQLRQLGQLKTQEAVSSAVLARNQQVAHDIKSPLTALLFASKDFDRLPDSSRKVIQTAVKRINSIVDGLNKPSEPKENPDFREERELGRLLEELVEEKKLEYVDRKNIEWILKVEPLAWHRKSPLTEMELKRALSNLLNNSVEALGDKSGMIQISAQINENRLQLSVEDNGKGIESGLMNRVGQRGFSSGKENGRGLGVSFAKHLAESRGGRFILESQLNQGTCVQLIV